MSVFTNFTVWPCEDFMTVAFVATITSQSTSAIVTGSHHTRVNFTTRTIVPRRTETTSISTLIDTGPTIVTTPLCTVVYWGLTMTTYKRQMILQDKNILGNNSNEASKLLLKIFEI